MPESRNILLVDDYEVNQIIGKRHLESAGYKVDVAVDGAAAVEAFTTRKYDLILMDIEMPVLDGWESTKRIRGLESADISCNTGRVPIIAMSGHVLEDDTARYQQAGMDDCMAKPIEREILLAIVEKWLGQPTASVQDAGAHKSAGSDPSDVDSAPIDLAKAIAEFMGDRDIVTHLLGEFVSKGDEQLATIEEALNTSDFERIRLETHALKGGAANLTAYSLADSCAGMEQAAENAAGDEVDHLPPLFSKLKHEFKRLKAYVSQTVEPESSAG
jgi:CheY-like chemotaxis protein